MAELRDRLAGVAEQLYSLDTDPQLSFVRSGSLRGRSASVVADVAPLIDRLWSAYPSVKERVDALSDDAPSDDPAGFRAVAGEVASLAADLERVLAVAGTLAEAWRRLLPWVDAAAASLAKARAEAARLRVDDDPALVEAVASLEDLQEQLAADPLAADATEASAAIGRAIERVRELSDAHRGLPEALDVAAAVLAQARSRVDEGREGLVAARAKVAAPEGLLEPLDPAVIDGGDRSLGPWLARLQAEAVEGDWQAVVAGLAQWRVVADGVLQQATQVAAANRAPVERRDALRGLLDAYEAKSAAARVAERADIVTLQREARAALHARPADLDAGERAVLALGRALGADAAARP